MSSLSPPIECFDPIYRIDHPGLLSISTYSLCQHSRGVKRQKKNVKRPITSALRSGTAPAENAPDLLLQISQPRQWSTFRSDQTHEGVALEATVDDEANAGLVMVADSDIVLGVVLSGPLEDGGRVLAAVLRTVVGADPDKEINEGLLGTASVLNVVLVLGLLAVDVGDVVASDRAVRIAEVVRGSVEGGRTVALGDWLDANVEEATDGVPDADAVGATVGGKITVLGVEYSAVNVTVNENRGVCDKYVRTHETAVQPKKASTDARVEDPYTGTSLPRSMPPASPALGM
jgi:hypothetical protein